MIEMKVVLVLGAPAGEGRAGVAEILDLWGFGGFFKRGYSNIFFHDLIFAFLRHMQSFLNRKANICSK